MAHATTNQISEKKKSTSSIEKALIASEIRYRRLFETAKDGILILDAKTGMIVDVNPFLIGLLGYSKESFIEKTIWDIGFFKNIIDNKDKFLELQRDEYVRYEDLPLETSDGSKINVEFVSNVYSVNSHKVIQCNIRDITERKQAEQKMIQLSAIVESSNEIIISKTLDGKITSWNKGAEKIYGYNESKVIGKPISLLIPPGHKDEIPEVLEKLKCGLSVDNFETERVAKDGRIIQVSLTISPIKIEDDKIIGVSTIGHDITERKLAEEALRESNERFQNVFEHSTTGKSITSPDGKLLKINKAFADMLGYSIDELQELNFTKITHPDDIALSKESIRGLLAQEKCSYNFEKRYYHKNGNIVWTDVGVALLFDKSKKPLYFMTSIQDITERKRSEETLKKLSSTVEQTANTIVITDREGIIEYVNPAFVEITGYSSDEALGKTPRILKSGTKDQKYYEGMWDTILSGKVFRADVINKKKNGDLYSEEKTITPIFDNNKNITHFVGTGVDTTQRKLAEEKLRESETMLLRSQEIGHLGSWEWDIVTNKVVWSDETFRIYGYQPNEIEANYEFLLKSMSNESRVKFNQSIEAALKGEKPFEMDYTFFTKDKDMRELHTIGDIKRDEEGNPLKMYGVTLDITERKHAEEKIRNLAKFPSENPFPVLRVAKNGTLLYVNESGKAQLPEWNLQIEHSVPNMIKEIVLKTLNNGKIQQVEFNQSEKTYSFYVAPIFGTEYANLYGLDITERKRAGEVLQQSEAKFRKLINSLPDPVLVVDTQGRITYSNENALKIFDYNLEEMLNHNIEDLIPKHFREHHKALMNKYITEPKSRPMGEGIELFARRNGGSEFPTEIMLEPVEINNTRFILAIVRDVTDRKRAEKELIDAKEKAEESDRLKSAFLANMSHEIRTPMSGILGFAELLKEPELSGEQQQEYLKIIEKSGERMLNIINDIVSISKIESGIIDTRLSETNINNQIKFVYDSLNLNAKSKGLNLSYSCTLPEREASIKTDSEKFYGILTNLVKNAIKYTDQGSIEFGYEIVETMHASSLQFFVKDTGIGIPKNRQEAIFARFIQADIVDKMARQGAGLGLAISKAYVEMLGGKIWVESEIGKGSTFYFTLPCNAEREEEISTKNIVASDKSNNMVDSEVSGLKILIVEDDEISSNFISIVVQNFGKGIIQVGTGTKAVEACRNNPDLDLIFMDIQLPDMNGYEATRQIRVFNKKVVIIAQTAFAMQGDEELALEAGCTDYISKPIKKDELMSLIQKYFH